MSEVEEEPPEKPVEMTIEESQPETIGDRHISIHLCDENAYIGTIEEIRGPAGRKLKIIASELNDYFTLNIVADYLSKHDSDTIQDKFADFALTDKRGRNEPYNYSINVERSMDGMQAQFLDSDHCKKALIDYEAGTNTRILYMNDRPSDTLVMLVEHFYQMFREQHNAVKALLECREHHQCRAVYLDGEVME